MPAPTSFSDLRLGLLGYTTDVYINDVPTTISLKRKVAEIQPSGGHTKVPVTLPPQKFRFVNQSLSDGLGYSPTDEGEVHSYIYVLIGAYDADIQIDDSWEEGDIQYHVDGIIPSTGYETRASVTGYAKEPIHG